MASESENSELSYNFERMIRNSDMSVLLPFIQGLSHPSPTRRNRNNPDQESESTEDSDRQRIILVNPSTQRMIIVEGVSSLETLFHELERTTKNSQPPASKESIEGMKRVEIEESDGGECVVCLEEFEVGGVVREMPCEHRFHGDCIEKWLGIHGSCPVCRYQMPVDEKEEGKKNEEEEEGEEGGERRRVGGEVWVSFSISRRRRNHDQNQATSDGDSNDSSSSPRDGDGDEIGN
ncbi:E3 ubiquitin-protein ligase MPSR1-like [Vicia villosa]|uniref:E3 ubiquitin-protein ligase MPSR1-like n=1 Tax=Vicia villosa TaxID=3911 RepID=UPI00273A8375|nr:E3 ubiquitin-protein ligase MPSR1-like [Vicia villosa]